MADIRTTTLGGIPFGINSQRPTNPQPGQPFFNGQESRLELYTSGTGWQNIVQETPAVVSVVGQLSESLSKNITINGTNFAAGAAAYVIGSNAIEIQANTTTVISVVEISANFPPLSPAFEPYDVKVVNPSNLYGILYDSLGVNNQPVWSTAAGSLGTFTELELVSISVSATDTIDSSNSTLVYSLISGTLPPGLSLSSSGLISGTLSSNVVSNTTYSFTIQVTDGMNTPITRNFSIIVADRPPVWSTGTTLPTFTRNVAYSTTVAATEDDSGAISYSLVSGSLPTGLSLNSSTGVISGTPTGSTTGIFTLRATVTASGTTTDRTFTIPNVGPVWSTAATLPTFTRNSAYSTTVVATDDSGDNPTYSIVSGSLPTGLSLSSSGVISGTPTSSLLETFTIRASDINNNSADRIFTIPNTGPVWSTAAGALPNASNATSYSTTVIATDDSGSVPTYSLFSGSLPTGLSLNSTTGVISGTPTSIGPSSFTIRATDANGSTADRAFSIQVLSGIVATGGSITSDSTYTYHAFTGSGTFQTTSFPSGSTVDVLVVAGGGAGGNDLGGGGGAGGVIYRSGWNVGLGSFSVAVGAGGTENDTTGNNSTFSVLTAFGGGRGANWSTQTSGNSGGSGGGGGARTFTAPGSATQTSNNGGTGYGNGGGTGLTASGGPTGGGGGAGGVGGNATTSIGGPGGIGLNLWSSWPPISNLGFSGYIAGGGAGNTDGGDLPGVGGLGGGGNGGNDPGARGAANSGGGGGMSPGYPGPQGGSGIVVVRYIK